MTIEEACEKELWNVLQEIKLQILRGSKYNLLVKYQNEIEGEHTIQKLVELNAIKVIDDPLKYASSYIENNPATLITADKINLIDYIESPNSIYLEILPNFYKLYSKYKRRQPNSQNKLILKYKLLKLDLVKGKIQWSNRKLINIKPNSKTIKFLALLIRNKRIVEYVEIAKELRLNSWREGKTNTEIATQVINAKNELVKFLKNTVELKESEIAELIENFENLGYKLRGY